MAQTLDITLPSRGILYKDPPLPEGKVQIRKLLIDELALFEGQGDAYTRMSAVIAATTVFPPRFDHNKLLAGDRFALLIALRNFSLPVKYPIRFVCSACGHRNTYKFDPRELAVTMAKTEGEDALVEPVEVALPDMGITVKVRFTRAEDQEATVKYVRQIQAKTGDLKNLTTKHTLARCLVEADGKPAGNVIEREQFVSQFSLYDTLVIQKEIEKREPGINTELNLECSSCAAINAQEMPFTPEFFRPADL